MKKVIDRVTYNTDTAECIFADDNGFDCLDNLFLGVAVYRSRKGRYFFTLSSNNGVYALVPCTESQAARIAEGDDERGWERTGRALAYNIRAAFELRHECSFDPDDI